MAKLNNWWGMLAFLGILVLILGWFTLYGEKGLVHYLELKEEIRRLGLLRTEMREKNRELYKEVLRLREDQQYIEKTARQELGLVRDSDIVYRFGDPLSDREKERGTPILSPDSGAHNP